MVDETMLDSSTDDDALFHVCLIDAAAWPLAMWAQPSSILVLGSAPNSAQNQCS